jgi:hypothetical protein
MKNFLIIPFAMIGTILVLSTSCKNNSFSNEVKTCDSLLTILKMNDSIITNVDSAMFVDLRKDVADAILAIENHYKSTKDTMSKKNAFLLSDYRLVFKGVKRFDQHYNEYKKEVKYSIQQVNSLKTDLINKSITEPLAKRFLAEEIKSVIELDMKVRSFDTMNKSTREKYIEQKPVIIQFQDSLTSSLSISK